MSQYEVHPMLEGMDEATRATFLQEFSDGYLKAAEDAEIMRDLYAAEKDDPAAAEWGADAEHYRAMAGRVLRGILDEPKRTGAMYSYSEAIGDRRDIAALQAERAGEEAPAAVVDAANEETALRTVALRGATALLTPRENEVAQTYMGAGVKRRDVSTILEGDKAPMALMTLDTHVRNVYRKWHTVAAVGEDSF